MRNSINLALMSLLLSFISFGSTYAIGKTTVDPNIGVANKAEEAVAIDTRLSKKVTIDIRDNNISVVLAYLSKNTGVIFRTGSNEKDYRVRDRKMTIIAKAVPLSNLMNSIANVMVCKWSRTNKDGLATYRLIMDKKIFQDAEESSKAESERIQKDMAEKRQKVFSNFANAKELSAKDMERLKDEDPNLYLATKSGVINPLGEFLQDTPAAMNALLSGRALTLNATDISDSAQLSLLKAASALVRMQSKLVGSSDTPEDFSTNSGQLSVEFNRVLEPGRGFGTQKLMTMGDNIIGIAAGPIIVNRTASRSAMLGDIVIRCGDQQIMMPIADPDNIIVKLVGQALIRTEKEGTPFSSVTKDMKDQFRDAQAFEKSNSDSDEPSPEHPDDPALAVKIDLKMDTKTWASKSRLDVVLGALAESSSYAVVSDSYTPSHHSNSVIPTGDVALRNVLDWIVDTYACNWEKRDNVLEFRNKQWRRKLIAFLPEEKVKGWRDSLKRNGYLDLPDLIQIAALNDDQIAVNVNTDDDLFRSGVGGIAVSNREVLRLYDAFSDNERSTLYTPSGLDIRTLSVESRNLAQTLINRKSSVNLQSPDTNAQLTGTRSIDGKQITYMFTLAITDGTVPLKCTVCMPTYKVPPQIKK